MAQPKQMVPAPKPAPILDKFFAMAAEAARRGNIQTLVMIGQDPVTGEMKVIATQGAMEATKDIVSAKYGLYDPEVDVGWPGA